MEKITVDKEEGIAEVIDRLLETKDDEVTLVVPKGSQLSRSVSNFHLLKREADGAGKTVLIESVDDTILAFAKASDLEANHPLWRGARGGVSDIVPAGMNRDEEVEATSKRSAPRKRAAKKAEPVKLTVHAEEEEEAEITVTGPGTIEEEKEEFETREKEFFGGGRFFGKRSKPVADDEDEEGNEEELGASGGSRKMTWIVVAVVVIVVAVLAIVTWAFGHVSITIDFKQTPWSFQGDFVADKSVSSIDAATDVIPAQVFTTQKNTTQSFPASGSANVSLKATGTITVWNAYSSAPQELVATTRFVTPDGKIFRLVSGITVPGAQVTNGQIIPSSITAAVVADQPGTAYNEGPVAKLSIPGFANTPKYNSFYGQLVSGTTGGFTGTKAVPTATDITNAKAAVTAALQTNLASALTTSYPNNFKILPGATSVSVTKLTVTTTTDASGNFSVYGEATLQAIGFDETMFKDFLLSQAQSVEASSTWSALTLTYSSGTVNFSKGTLSFSLSAQGSLEPAFSADDFKASIEGGSIGSARSAIAALPQLADGSISVWPVWLWSVPKNPGKIAVTAH
jgi:hypothetical protein